FTINSLDRHSLSLKINVKNEALIEGFHFEPTLDQFW
ncbi:MAG: hypothetical protein ACI9G9_000592, partial [Psychromonas sp.]